jgi:IrrE N-terminal-like domain
MSAANPGVQFTLRWLASRKRMTTCDFAIFIDDIAVWPARGEDDVWLQIQIDDLLGYLTDFWKPLMLRQVYPIDVSPMRPSDLRRAAEERWAELPPASVEAEEEAVSNFEEAHDLARCFAGVFGLPPFWILRSGDNFVLETARTLWKLPFEAVHAALSGLGDEICERLAAADQDRWGEAIEAWRQRDDADATGLLAWSVGLDRSLAKLLIEEGALEAPRDFNDAANDNDELRIAARMAGALPPDQIREIIGLARQFDGHNAEPLRRLSQACANFISEGFDRAFPFQQGEAAANFAREHIQLSSDRAVDIFGIVAGLGVDVRHAAAEPPTLDGIAIWGARHGPGVFLNESSRRIVRNGEAVEESLGARVTLAHELCHLLLDGRHALTAVEVLKARMPTGVEQRAKSFAGEFLLPSRTAAQHWIEADRPSNRAGLDALVEELVDMFGVTRSVAAWKLEHGARSYNVELGAILDAVAPRR